MNAQIIKARHWLCDKIYSMLFWFMRPEVMAPRWVVIDDCLRVLDDMDDRRERCGRMYLRYRKVEGRGGGRKQ